MAVKIVTDSTAHIDPAILRELDITEVALSVNFAEDTFKENEIDNETLFRLADKSPRLPTSSQPPPLDFYNAFVRCAEAGDEVIAVCISADLSGTYYSAMTARNMVLERYPKAGIEVVDSRWTVMGLGLAVIAAAKTARAGSTSDEIIALIKSILNRSRLLFVPKTLEYLHRGGRIGDAAALMGNLLQIKPILTLAEGKVTVFEKIRTTEKAIKRIVDVFEQDVKEKGLGEVVVIHVNNLELAGHLAEELGQKYSQAISVVPVSPVIGVHAGPGAMGIVYYTAS